MHNGKKIKTLSKAGRHLHMAKNRAWKKNKIVKQKKHQYYADILKNILFTKLIDDKQPGQQIVHMLKKTKIHYERGNRFYYYIDENVSLWSDKPVIHNLPLDYTLIAHASLEEIKRVACSKKISKEMRITNENILSAVEEYLLRCVKYLKNLGTLDTAERVSRIITEKSRNMEDALQRILIWNQFLHQSGHTLMGLGRLDKILDRYCEGLSNKETEDILTDFCICLHRHYIFKSQALLGDTGQLIVLGGLEEDGSYFCNNITGALLDIISRLNLPDPKLLLRVSASMPRKLAAKACSCIVKGNGSPLLSNDDLIIPLMQEFGYEKEDTYGYCTSACWEPLIPGKTMDQNNLDNVIFAGPMADFLNVLEQSKYQNFESLLNDYCREIEKQAKRCAESASAIKWKEDPLLTMFYPDCLMNGRDISEGGARYNNYGLLSVGLSNTADALLNIKKAVYEEKKFTLQELKDVMKQEEIFKKLSSVSPHFGDDSDIAVQVSQRLFDAAKAGIADVRNSFGGRFKIGLSSPGYVDCGKKIPETPDGRKAGEPLGVHISSMHGQAYTELVSFAASLDYSRGGFNGNVVDIMAAPSFIENNFEKFVDFLQFGIKRGFFQMQMNVVSSSILLEAQKHPEKFTGLIVRVWGFSAYFNDLPEEYKNLLIRRALQNEGKV